MYEREAGKVLASHGLRRRAVLVGAAQAALWRGPAHAAVPVLRVLAWPGYADPDWVQAFEARHGARVEVTIVGSDEVLRAKLADSRGPGYDVVAANTVELAALLARDELAPLTLADLPQVARQLPRFRGPIEGIVRNGKTYAVPKNWGTTGIAYNSDKVKSKVTSGDWMVNCPLTSITSNSPAPVPANPKFIVLGLRSELANELTNMLPSTASVPGDAPGRTVPSNT